jgi:hypothetical protein
MGISSDAMAAYATRWLKDKGPEHWASMTKALVQARKDPYVFDVLISAMIEHYVGLFVDSTVRSRLASLKQTHTVA